MITHIQLSLAEVFEDHQNKSNNNQYIFFFLSKVLISWKLFWCLLLLIFTLQPDDLITISFTQRRTTCCYNAFSQFHRHFLDYL